MVSVAYGRLLLRRAGYTPAVEYEWDPEKDRLNRLRHDRIRIISAREIRARERQQYEQQT